MTAIVIGQILLLGFVAWLHYTMTKHVTNVLAALRQPAQSSSIVHTSGYVASIPEEVIPEPFPAAVKPALSKSIKLNSGKVLEILEDMSTDLREEI